MKSSKECKKIHIWQHRRETVCLVGRLGPLAGNQIDMENVVSLAFSTYFLMGEGLSRTTAFLGPITAPDCL